MGIFQQKPNDDLRRLPHQIPSNIEVEIKVKPKKKEKVLCLAEIQEERGIRIKKRTA